tara:strand:- start:24 stop:359 length:336 start_codon:yes stop_codon:yes gene_type:complete
MKISEIDLDELLKAYPERRFAIHNGFSGWSYGAPQDPHFVTKEAALKILNLTSIKETREEILKILPEVQPVVAYTERGTDLFEMTKRNIFIQLVERGDCVFEDKSSPLKNS